MKLKTEQELKAMLQINDRHYFGKEVDVLVNPDTKQRTLVVLDGEHAIAVARSVRKLAAIQLNFITEQKLKNRR